MTDFLTNSTYQVYDSSISALKTQTYSHFALGDALIRQVNTEDIPAIIHFWPIDQMIILGMMDTKLPYLDEGVSFLKNEGYQVCVRPAGGLAVVADPGIINFSLILQEPANSKVSIDAGYEVMLRLIQKVLTPYNKEIKAYEIEDSYCPGKFDLSIDGKKFAGIAQRRFKKGIAIMIYLSVEGNQQRRGELIQTLYEKGMRGEETRWEYPAVNPDSMANLSDLLGVSLTVPQIKEMVLTALKEEGNRLIEGNYTAELMTEYQSAYDKMEKRNIQTFGN